VCKFHHDACCAFDPTHIFRLKQLGDREKRIGRFLFCERLSLSHQVQDLRQQLAAGAIVGFGFSKDAFLLQHKAFVEILKRDHWTFVCGFFFQSIALKCNQNAVRYIPASSPKREKPFFIVVI
jgi:hypothetical protein